MSSEYTEKTEYLRIGLSVGKFLIGTVALGIFTLMVNSQMEANKIVLEKSKFENQLKLEQQKYKSDYIAQFLEFGVAKNLDKRRDFVRYLVTLETDEEAIKIWNRYLQNVENGIKNSKISVKKIDDLRTRIAMIKNPGSQNEEVDWEEIYKLQTELKEELFNYSMYRSKTTEYEDIFDIPKSVKSATHETNQNWVFLGTYNKETKAWMKRYFEIERNIAPNLLVGKKIEVTAEAVNVRNSPPNEWAEFGGIVGSRNSGDRVKILQIVPWYNTGFIWARI